MVKPVTRGIVLLWQEFVLVVVMLCCCSWLYCKDCTSHGSPTVQPAGHGIISNDDIRGGGIHYSRNPDAASFASSPAKSSEASCPPRGASLPTAGYFSK